MQKIDKILTSVIYGSTNEIDLFRGNIGDAELARICETVISCGTPIYFMDLSDNRISDIGISQSLCMLLDCNTTIKEIKLDHNNITSVGGELLLYSLLGSNSTLTSIHLKDNNIPEKLLEDINSAVSFNKEPAIIKRRLSRQVVCMRSSLNGSEREGIEEGVYRPPTNIRYPDLGSEEEEKQIDLHDQGNKMTLSLLIKVINGAKFVESLNLQNCNLFDTDIEQLMPVLVKLPRLQEINFSQNSISSHGFRVIANLLKTNQTLKHLNMSRNKANNDSGQFILDALFYNDTITSIDLSQNSITPRVLEEIKRSIDINLNPRELKKAMQAMQIDNPEVTDIQLQWIPEMQAAGHMLGPVLGNSTHITNLNLSNAMMGDDGAKELAVGLRHNSSLLHLELANNGLSFEGGFAIADAVSYHPTLLELNLANNVRLGNALANVFVQILRINNVLMRVNFELNDVSVDLLNEVEGLCHINTLPLGIKQLLPYLESTSYEPKCDAIDFSKYDGHRYLTAESTRILGIALGSSTQKVKYLDLSNNNLGDIGVGYLVPYLRKAKTLEALKMNAVSMSDVSAADIIDLLVWSTSIKVLELEDNPLTDISGEAILKMVAGNDILQQINVSRSKISPAMQEEIEKTVDLNREPLCLKRAFFILRNEKLIRSLHTIDLSKKGIEKMQKSHNICVTNATISKLVPVIMGDEYLCILDLSGAKINEPSAVLLAEFLAHHNCKLSELNLMNTTFDDQCLKILAKEGIARNTSLKEMNLQGLRKLTEEGIKALIESLEFNPTCIECLLTIDKFSPETINELNYVLLLNTVFPPLKKCIYAVSRNDSACAKLLFSGPTTPSINDTSVQLLTRALAKNKVVLELDLSSNIEITDKGIQALCDDVLLKNHTLLKLDLRGNEQLTDVAGKHLLQCLECNDNLYALKLEGCQISEHVMLELQYMMELNCGPVSLKHAIPRMIQNAADTTELDFNGNGKNVRKFDNVAIEKLCSILVENTLVRKIDLANNNIFDEGASYLADALTKNHYIEVIFLENNGITEIGGQMLLNAIKSNPNVKHITLGGNMVPPRVYEDITAILKVNQAQVDMKKAQRTLEELPKSVAELDNQTLFRDINYFNAKNMQIWVDAFAGCPTAFKPKCLLHATIKPVKSIESIKKVYAHASSGAESKQ